MPTTENTPWPATNQPDQKSIVVADRGHVWVGHIVEMAEGDFIRIVGARIVRRWGTIDGLNQLANEGPRRDTKLDAPATVLVRRAAVFLVIPCEASAWTT